MLHIVYQSPVDSQNLKDCLAVFSLEDVLLLIENGVFCALSGTALSEKLADLANSQRIFVLTPHAAERGVLNQLMHKIQLIDFEGFVDLVVEQYPILRW
jgi:tRNA 2-thiouridine synthesizing protein B